MIFFISKVLVTSILIVLISEIAKVNDKLGGLLAALPITTFLIIFSKSINDRNAQNNVYNFTVNQYFKFWSRN